MQVGYDPELDAARGFTVTERGVTVIPQSYAEAQILPKDATRSKVDQPLGV